MPEFLKKLLEEARARVPEIDPDEVNTLLDSGDLLHLIDVRDTEELIMGAIPGSVHASRGTLEMQIHDLVPDTGARVVLYCAGGLRSLFAGKTLQELGYENVFSMKGGYHAWRESGHPVG